MEWGPGHFEYISLSFTTALRCCESLKIALWKCLKSAWIWLWKRCKNPVQIFTFESYIGNNLPLWAPETSSAPLCLSVVSNVPLFGLQLVKPCRTQNPGLIWGDRCVHVVIATASSLSHPTGQVRLHEETDGVHGDGGDGGSTYQGFRT